MQNDTTENRPAYGPSALTVVLDDVAEQKDQRIVVRLRTTTWRDEKGLHSKKSLMFLRRQCVGFNGLEEDASAIGAGEALASIVNLDECRDGIYEAVVCDVNHDWETGHADDWSYKLVPISTPNVVAPLPVDVRVGRHCPKRRKDKSMNLHNEIMNLQCRVPKDANINQRLSWKEGHKQARHDAAELANVADAEIARLRSENERLTQTLKGIKRGDTFVHY